MSHAGVPSKEMDASKRDVDDRKNEKGSRWNGVAASTSEKDGPTKDMDSAGKAEDVRKSDVDGVHQRAGLASLTSRPLTFSTAPK